MGQREREESTRKRKRVQAPTTTITESREKKRNDGKADVDECGAGGRPAGVLKSLCCVEYDEYQIGREKQTHWTRVAINCTILISVFFHPLPWDPLDGV